MLTASITGLFKTLLIIIGALVVLRFFGRVMIAKRNLEEERELLKNDRALKEERERKQKNLGKVEIVNRDKSSSTNSKIEDVDFEEVN